METFIPSAPSPAGSPAPASGQGSQAASTDTAASPAGLFRQILSTSCAEHAPGNGEPAGGTASGREENASKDDAGGDPASAGNPAAAVLLAVGLPAFAEEASPDAGGTVSPEAPSTVSAAGPTTVGSSAAAAHPQNVFTVSPGATAERSAVTADANAAANSAAKDASAATVSVEAGTAGTAPAETATAGAAPAKAAQGSSASGGADPRAAFPAADVSSSAPVAEQAAGRAAEQAAGRAADPSAVASKDARPAQPDGSYAAAKGEPDPGRIAPPSPAPGEGKPQAVPSVTDGKPSLASGEGDAGTGSDTGNEAWEPAASSMPSGKKKAETAFRAEKPADPAAPQAVAADRYAAARASAPRPAASDAAPAAAPRQLQVGENAFVLTRRSETSLEVTLAPPGMGKLELEVVLEKGVVNANITAADPAGREAIERSLPQIIEALARDGMAVGGFTVSLKQRENREGNAQTADPSGNASTRPVPPAAVRAAAAPAGLVDLFV